MVLRRLRTLKVTRSAMAAALALTITMPAPAAACPTPGAAAAVAEAFVAAPPKGKPVATRGGAAAKPSAKELKIQRHLTMAQYYLLRENDPKLAMKEYQAVLRLDRAHTRAGLELAELQVRAGDGKKALATLKKLTKAAPKDPAPWYGLGVAHLKAKDPKAALAAFEQVLAVAPGHADAHREKAAILLDRVRAGEVALKDQLATHLRLFIHHAKRDHSPQYKLAQRLLAELEGGELALTIFDAKTAYDAAFTENRIGVINQHMGRARRGFERCRELAPKNEACAYWLGMVYSSVKASDHYDPAKAVALFRAAASVPEAHVELARVARREDDMQAARTALEAALKLDPGHQTALLELGILHKVEGRDDDAVAALLKAYQVDRHSHLAAKAVGELALIRPDHQLVLSSLRYGSMKSDVFSTEKFKGAITELERRMGGLDPTAAEQKVLEAVLERIIEANGISRTDYTFKVSVMNTKIVNAFAVPNGNIYFTKGFFEMLKKSWPDRPIDEHHDVLGHVMAHEVVHVIRQHTVRQQVYREAVADADRHLDPAVLTHVTRIHEIEADRDGIVLAFLAGYHPRGGIEFMESRGKHEEIPSHLDHPTYDERIHYLEEYWSNDVKYAWMSFSFGLQKMEEAARAEAEDVSRAAGLYGGAIEDFKRYRDTLIASKEILNNMGIAYAKLGVFATVDGQSPLSRWSTGFSVERDLALKYVSVRKAEAQQVARKRSGSEDGDKEPWQLKQAVALFREALRQAPDYQRARVNLATAYLALGRLDDASRTLAEVKAGGEVDPSEVMNLQGVVDAEAGRGDKAVEAFRAAAKGAAAREAASFNVAVALERAGKKGEAQAAYQSFVQAFPDSVWARSAKRAIEVK